MAVLSRHARRGGHRRGYPGRDPLPAGAAFRTMKIREPQHLIFDADDTLWENNIYFEDAFDRFCEFLNHSRLTPDQIRATLDEIETVNIKVHGYGAKNFARNLAECYRHLCERGIGEEDVRHVMSFAEEILN